MQLRLRKDSVFTLLCKIAVTNPKFHTWYIEYSRHDEFQADKQKYWKAHKFDGVNEESNA